MFSNLCQLPNVLIEQNLDRRPTYVWVCSVFFKFLYGLQRIWLLNFSTFVGVVWSVLWINIFRFWWWDRFLRSYVLKRIKVGVFLFSETAFLATGKFPLLIFDNIIEIDISFMHFRILQLTNLLRWKIFKFLTYFKGVNGI